MKSRITIFALSAMALVFAANTNAATITTGGLTYDDATGVITGTNGTTYLSWDQAAELNYQETLAATAVGGEYEAYHIASRAEAYEFYYLATTINTQLQVYPGLDLVFAVDPIYEEGMFGANATATKDLAYFDGGDAGYAGVIAYTHDALNDFWWIDPSNIDIEITDEFSATGSYPETAATWLLVGDATLIATPLPAALFMFAPALLGFFGFRSKMQA